MIFRSKRISFGLFLSILLLATTVVAGSDDFRIPSVAFNSLSTQQGLSQSTVFSVVQDKYGFLWIGTRFGLNRYDGYEMRRFHYNAADPNTLSNNEITSIYVDHNNDVWVGTRGGGLNRYIYERDEFVRYSNLNYENTVTSIIQDDTGTLWIGTTEGLLMAHNTHDPDNTFFENVSVNTVLRNYNNQILPHSKTYISVESLLPIGKDSILAGTEAGLFLYLHRQKQFNQIDLKEGNDNKVNSIALSPDGDIWAATFNGLMRFSVSDGNWSNPTITDYSPRSTDPSKRLLVDRVEDVVYDPLGNIWIGTRGGGLSKIEPSGALHHYLSDFSDPSSIQDNIINSLMVDKYGVLWVGTESKGCNYLDLYQKKFHHIRKIGDRWLGSGNNMVTAIAGANPNEVWVGTALQGIARLSIDETGGHIVENINTIPVRSAEAQTSEIMSLLLDDQQNLWIGTASNSLTRYRPDIGFTSYITNGYVFALHQDAMGQIWYGTWGQGLGIVDSEMDEVRQIATNTNINRSLSSDKVLSIFDDSEGNLWVGTKGSGVNVIPLEMISSGSSDFVVYNHNSLIPGSISHDDVFCITEDSRGRVWIGTGNGLNRVVYPEGGSLTDAALKNEITFKAYHEVDGLPNSVIYSIIEDSKGKLWLSTFKGISVFDPDTESFENYVRSDGLQDDEFHFNAYSNLNNGFICLGGTNGLTFFHPDSIKHNPFTLKPVITGVKVYNEQVLPNTEVNGRVIIDHDIPSARVINLLHKDKEITFEFSGLHFANPDNLQYSYRLLGFNDTWQTTHSNARSVTYTNLDASEYIFQVRVANTDGSYSDEIAELTLQIAPPWWHSPWSYALYASIILFLLLTFRKYSIIGVKEKNRLQIERMENAKLRELTDAKMKFFTNISHEIRTPLTLIKDPLDHVISQGSIDSQSKEYLGVMKKNVDRLFELINQLLQLRRIDLGKVKIHREAISINSFVTEIAKFFENYANLKGVSIRTNLPPDPIVLSADREQLKTIVYNLLSNAIKHSPPNCKVVLSIYQQEGGVNLQKGWLSRLLLGKAEIGAKKWVVLNVTDSGEGIADEEIEKVFQRFYQVDKSKTAKTGSGIGLSLVKEYVEMHGGAVNVLSSTARGCVFKVLLPDLVAEGKADPVVKDEAKQLTSNESLLINDYFGNMPQPDDGDDQQDNTEQERNAGIAQFNGNPEVELLIIEDDRDLADYMTHHLTPIYHVTAIYDGQKAMTHIAASPPDVIISDIMLPGMNGIEICQNVKSNPNTSHIPIMLLTAQSDEESELKGYDSGADLYVSKPFSVELLKKQLKTLLQNRQSIKNMYSRKILVEPTDTDVISPDEKFLKRFIEIVDNHLSDTDFDVSSLVGYMNMSHTKILRKVKTITGLSLVEFIRNFRLKKAALIMQKEKFPVAELGFMVGFSDPKYFSKCFVRMYGKTPTEYYHELHPEEQSE